MEEYFTDRFIEEVRLLDDEEKALIAEHRFKKRKGELQRLAFEEKRDPQYLEADIYQAIYDIDIFRNEDTRLRIYNSILYGLEPTSWESSEYWFYLAVGSLITG